MNNREKHQFRQTGTRGAKNTVNYYNLIDVDAGIYIIQDGTGRDIKRKLGISKYSYLQQWVQQGVNVPLIGPFKGKRMQLENSTSL